MISTAKTGKNLLEITKTTKNPAAGFTSAVHLCHVFATSWRGDPCGVIATPSHAPELR